jgi:hypothetical protein
LSPFLHPLNTAALWVSLLDIPAPDGFAKHPVLRKRHLLVSKHISPENFDVFREYERLRDAPTRGAAKSAAAGSGGKGRTNAQIDGNR